MAAPSLETLPVEIGLTVLTSLHTVQDVLACIRAVPALLQVFNFGRRLIISHFLLRAAPESLHPDLVALACFQGLPRCMGASGRLSYFLDRATAYSFIKTGRVRLGLLPRVESTQRLAHFFALDYADRALAGNPLNGPNPDEPVRLSPTEYDRLCRTFYLVEVHRSLFALEQRMEENLTPQQMQSIFGARFAHWELEQLLSVIEYLVERLRERAYNSDFGLSPPLASDRHT